jgi:hypothetical protein
MATPIQLGEPGRRSPLDLQPPLNAVQGPNPWKPDLLLTTAVTGSRRPRRRVVRKPVSHIDPCILPGVRASPRQPGEAIRWRDTNDLQPRQSCPEYP